MKQREYVVFLAMLAIAFVAGYLMHAWLHGL